MINGSTRQQTAAKARFGGIVPASDVVGIRIKSCFLSLFECHRFLPSMNHLHRHSHQIRRTSWFLLVFGFTLQIYHLLLNPPNFGAANVEKISFQFFIDIFSLDYLLY